MECKLSRSNSSWSCVVKLRFHTDAKGAPIPVRNLPFGKPITHKSLVEDRIRCAQFAILNPTKNFNNYLQGGLPKENELSFSKNYVSSEISGKDLADLSFVDLPGLIASVGARGNDRDIDLVKSLVTSYIEKPSCVILLTVACESGCLLVLAELFQKLIFSSKLTSRIRVLTTSPEALIHKESELSASSTIINVVSQCLFVFAGVLTKPDRIPVGEEHRWLKIIRNEAEHLVNNWYCVRQPSSELILKGITWKQAHNQENEYFSTTQPWCSLESQYQIYLRTSSLTERLSIILSELVAKRWAGFLHSIVMNSR